MSDDRHSDTEDVVKNEEEPQVLNDVTSESTGVKRTHEEAAGPDVKAALNEAEEEEDEGEDEEDEDEDDEEDDSVARKRKRARGANQFFDIEAEVDDEEEDEADEDDEDAELLREEFISDDKAEEGTREQIDDRMHREYDRRRQEVEDQDAEVLAQTLKERYRKTHTVYRGDSTTSGTVSQKLLMPSINDPAIYAVRCTPGREKEVVRKLYEKKRTLDRAGKPLDILTVFQRDSFRGYVYIEAKRPDAVDRALNGMVNVYIRDKLLVPVKEYPDLLKQVKSTDVEIVPGIYVRITRGKNKGDLAIVDNLSENGLDVRCKLVPRLDYGRNDDFDKDGKRIKLKIKPLPRLFSEQDARMYDGEFLQPGRVARSFIYRGEEYIQGFLYKDFKIQFIQTKDVHPTLEELDRFQTGGAEDEGMDLAAIAALIKNNKADGKYATFQPGDKVEIRRGEQAKTIAVVAEADISEVTIIVTDSGDPKFVNQRLTVPANDLRKIFREGDHVRVVEGKHSEETGLVIKIDGDSVVLVSDQSKEDVRVFANYLVKATDAFLAIDRLSANYDIKDLVQLNASSVGVIVKAEKGVFEILEADGRLISVKPSGIASKLNMSKREQVATDRNGLTIKVGDTVREALGDKKREGAILHIYKNSLFIKSHEIIENIGIFVTNRMNVTTVSTKDSIVSKNLGPDLSGMNPNLKLPNPSAATSGLRTMARGRDKLIQKDVRVTGGSYKGLMGKVVDADDTIAIIELHTKPKKIRVAKTNLNVLIRGEAIPYLRFIGAPMDNQMYRPNAPAFTSGGRSAWNGGVTPGVVSGGASSWGGGTAWGGNKTPAYNGNQSTWDGGKTPGGNSTWGSGGSNSTWGKGGNSTWGSGGNNSTWGKGGNSTWGSKGGNSTWGNNDNNKNGRSAWGKD